MAGSKINSEWGWIRKNLTLRIKLYHLEGDTKDRVIYIEVESGKRKNILECYLKEDGSMGWDYTEKCWLLQVRHTMEKLLERACILCWNLCGFFTSVIGNATSIVLMSLVPATVKQVTGILSKSIAGEDIKLPVGGQGAGL
ncbi:hypothetical protein KP79_PYT02701 [Mizuhopecten yessoensis]|uniref:Uncharacterized protein n=1 Tax=Mizuhopecten yessoensis TaxID=6573 RepID=A0A210PK61_MIZYE|nr:hypothetical protein KP79_PYT02701 [Mizuhopecten yessoensis]